ncbi:uncharacterized protein [Drosophila virilis]|uniref:Uncharacterized protein n=1 Tax=Drosophila virilis TaxID=7244 RepID=A0A0Q9VZ96_DROVI|nr:uncharacterized protein LOC26531260 [Drosophila virilis]KRF77862.1 uncharacterized protein Dvir_GJ26490 [Drosophila virilis]
MFKIKPVKRVQYQRLLIDKDRTLKRLQGFRKLRIILLKTVFALLINVQRKSQYATSNQALQSLKQCREWLTDCLVSLQRLHHKRSKCKIIVPNIEYKKGSQNVLGRYIACLKRVLNNYENYQRTMHPLAHRSTARNNLKKMLFENMGVMQLAIEMFRLFMQMGNNVFIKANEKKMSSKKVQCSSSSTGQCNSGQIFLEQKENTVSSLSKEENLNNQSIETRTSQRDEDTISGIDQAAINSSSRNIDQSSRSRGGGRVSSQNLQMSRIDLTFSDTSQLYLKGLQQLRHKISSASKIKLRSATSHFKSMFKLRKHHEWEKQSPSMSVVSEEIKADTMQDTAAAIINSLFDYKSAPRAMIKKSSKYISNFDLHLHLYEEKKDDEKVDEVWQDLISEHNQQLSAAKDKLVSDIKEDLKKFYLTKMQLLLQAQIGKLHQIKKRRLHGKSASTFSMRNSTVKTDWKSMEKTEILQRMHKMFFTTLRKKLSCQRNNPKIRRLHSLIMSEELPVNASDHDILKEYERDPHFYNVLIMSHNKDSDQDAGMLAIIEHNFDKIMCRLARHKRQKRMWQYSTKWRQPSFHHFSWYRDDFEILLKQEKIGESAESKNVLVIDDYCKVERAKWAKYFADQEKTPTMLHLEDIRKQKRQVRSAQRRTDRKCKIMQKKRPKTGRPLTALYTAPRLTHRMRQAVDRIAEEAQVSTEQGTKSEKHSPDLKANTMPLSEEVEGHNIADVLLHSASWTSCCSKCRNVDEAMSSGSALEQFFRTHEQILTLGNSFCNGTSAQ